MTDRADKLRFHPVNLIFLRLIPMNEQQPKWFIITVQSLTIDLNDTPLRTIDLVIQA
ncbi:hypothetical protein D3C80_1776720 [compost metagenome]